MTQRGSPAIRSVAFRHNAKPTLGFEIFLLSELYERARRDGFDHHLWSPQRPEFHAIYIGLRGKAEMVVDFAPVAIGARTLTFVARGRVQQFVPDRSLEAWVVLFTPDFLLAGSDAADPLANPVTLSPAWAPPAISLAPADAREILALSDQLAREHARPLDDLQPALLAAQLRVLMLRAERLLDRSAPVPPAVQRFLTILERDHAATRSVAHYAKQAGVSARRLAELVHAHSGKSTKQVIDDRVILELKRLLVHTEISVKELAARTGFPEPTNLVKFFRHHADTTPLAFRDRYRRNLPSGRGS